jgi:hypothetical protein
MKLEECSGATLDEIRANEPATCSYGSCPARYDFCTAGVFISFAGVKAGLFPSRASGGWLRCSWENALWNDSDIHSILKSRKRRKVAEKGEMRTIRQASRGKRVIFQVANGNKSDASSPNLTLAVTGL